MKGKVPQNKDLQINSLPSETSMDYTKCMKLTKKHGIVSENMEYTRMFWSLILPIHHNMKHEMATFCETIIHNFYFHAPCTKYRAPGVMDYGSQHISFHHCTTIKFILGGRFKETKLFSEQKKRIGVFYLKSCRPSIFSLICERESDQNNRIIGN